MIDLRGLSPREQLEVLDEQYKLAALGMAPKEIMQENGEKIVFSRVNFEEAKKIIQELKDQVRGKRNIGPAIAGGW